MRTTNPRPASLITALAALSLIAAPAIAQTPAQIDRFAESFEQALKQPIPAKKLNKNERRAVAANLKVWDLALANQFIEEARALEETLERENGELADEATPPTDSEATPELEIKLTDDEKAKIEAGTRAMIGHIRAEGPMTPAELEKAYRTIFDPILKKADKNKERYRISLDEYFALRELIFRSRMALERSFTFEDLDNDAVRAEFLISSLILNEVSDSLVK